MLLAPKPNIHKNRCNSFQIFAWARGGGYVGSGVELDLNAYGPIVHRHLDRPFLPHTVLTNHGSPGPTEVPECPQTQASNILWFQEKELKYYSIPKSPLNESSSRFPNGASMETVARFQVLFFTYLSSRPASVSLSPQ